jgi:tetratricopeptide (TPR) repeat protein
VYNGLVSTRKRYLIVDLALMALFFVSVAGVVLLFVPNGYERLAWHAQSAYARLERAVLRLPETLPTPVVVSAVSATAKVVTLAASPAPVSTSIPAATAATGTPPPAGSALPPSAEITGFTQVWQKVNNCGPASLAMALSHWGWQGTQANTASALKPDADDRNVSPYEMADYARQMGLGAVVRMGGQPGLLKRLIAAGYPVLLETGLTLPDQGWEGHYTLVSGYSETRKSFTTQDSLRGPNFQVTDEDLYRDWRAFNFIYLVIYPTQQEPEVLALLGPDADEKASAEHAEELARQQIPAAEQRALAFAYFNLGSSLTALGEYAEAAAAYDQARVAELPWRMLWYQTGPLEAYYRIGRYEDVLTLVDATLKTAKNLEEMYFWRGQCFLAQGDREGAINEFQEALRYNRYNGAARDALAMLGVTP